MEDEIGAPLAVHIEEFGEGQLPLAVINREATNLRIGQFRHSVRRQDLRFQRNGGLPLEAKKSGHTRNPQITSRRRRCILSNGDVQYARILLDSSQTTWCSSLRTRDE